MSYQQFGHVDPGERLDHSEDSPAYDEELPRRRLPIALLAGGAIVVFAGALWFAYHMGTEHATVAVAAPGSAASPAAAPAEVPLIRASTDPVKVKPDKAGGMTIPDRDDPLYTMKPGQSPAEHILPPPEAPQPRPVAPPPAPPAPQVAQGPVPNTAFPPPLPAPPQAGSAPRTVERPEKPAEAARPAAGGPPVKIQLASLRTPDEAREEWARLKHEHADLLGKFTAVAVRADLGDRGVWYRVEAGPVGDKAAAVKLCKALKERDLGCQLVP